SSGSCSASASSSRAGDAPRPGRSLRTGPARSSAPAGPPCCSASPTPTPRALSTWASTPASVPGTAPPLRVSARWSCPPAPAPGGARADWHVLMDVSARLGHPRGWCSSRDVAAEIARAVPTHSGYDWDLLGEPWAPVAGPPDMPPELWHPAGESGPLPVYQVAPSLEEVDGSVQAPPPRLTTSWPLRWELRAVDATRRRGWVWPIKAAAGPNPVSRPAAPAP